MCRSERIVGELKVLVFWLKSNFIRKRRLDFNNLQSAKISRCELQGVAVTKVMQFLWSMSYGWFILTASFRLQNPSDASYLQHTHAMFKAYIPINIYLYVYMYILGGSAILTSPNHLWTVVVWLSWFALSEQELNMSDCYLCFLSEFFCWLIQSSSRKLSTSFDKKRIAVLANHVGSLTLWERKQLQKSKKNIYADSPTPVAPWYNPDSWPE